jgi:hypothetical protein
MKPIGLSLPCNRGTTSFTSLAAMAHSSTPVFQTFHALRIKGFATVDTLVEMTAQPGDDVERHLAGMLDAGRAQFREARGLWQLTPDGRTAYPDLLAADLAGADLVQLGPFYASFLEINGSFKELCGDWQLRDGEVNDHGDAAYDDGVISRLVALDEQAQPVVSSMGEVIERLGQYTQRLSQTLVRLQTGETNMFTGVMCGSYHDAWMELHEDLILTQGIDRSAEGSF